ncbi:hypothetical protein Goklo_021801 [Gossypium klotzschianum]|uniref:Uncharacterized protein n=1 Tax=Gossypium klotzschianum TaxID=34286 RepID=A0A7J8UWM1_9ROSI|nr:hypothetical protein [Gossypium klotzschianum]
MNEIAACGGVLKVVLALFSGRYVAGGLEMAVLMAIKEAAEMNLFANIEGSLRRMTKVRIEVTNRGKNGMAEAFAKAGMLGNTLFKAYW